MSATIPSLFREAFDSLAYELDVGRNYLESRLRAELDDLSPVTIKARVKEARSAYAKLQRGELSNLMDMDDLIAARAVFLHPTEVRQAISACASIFPVLEEKNLDVGKPDDFRYQQPHLIVAFPTDYTDRRESLQGVKIEIQFTTYIQHALQESTHDVIYKGERFSWREHRLDGRLRGLLEIVDDVLENLQNVANIDTDPDYRIFDDRNRIIESARRLWVAEQMPTDLRRFAITVEDLLRLTKLTVIEWEALADRSRDIIDAYSLTTIDKVIGVIARYHSDAFVSGLKKRKIVVSTELEELVPEAKRIPRDNRVLY
ncbi:hypothetical protein [Kribbella sp. DT2]|uniref:hypothetical protein n=1 Tax=Kribbella sp. DT2 TaxID=3393427 RepID=UPI003CE83F2D